MADEEFDDESGADTGQAEVDKWKALARKHEEQAKANSAAAKRLAEIEAASKSAEEKAAEARAAAEKERDEARLALLKRDAAEEAGLPKSWADRLRGTTKEELDADAKVLAKDLTPQPQQTSARPVADLKAGALPAGEGRPTNPSAAMDAAIRGAVSGRSSRRIT